MEKLFWYQLPLEERTLFQEWMGSNVPGPNRGPIPLVEWAVFAHKEHLRKEIERKLNSIADNGRGNNELKDAYREGVLDAGSEIEDMLI